MLNKQRKDAYQAIDILNLVKNGIKLQTVNNQTWLSWLFDYKYILPFNFSYKH